MFLNVAKDFWEFWEFFGVYAQKHKTTALKKRRNLVNQKPETKNYTVCNLRTRTNRDQIFFPFH